ncbi:BREX-1 system adenine-specific DNA-methyltransferase PglX [Vibrio metschnikovii]|nr:BREX-1 system adenine-specific DNA-methyltransferase PglX [Vibrio metschnikovii]HCG7769727.1 BREX-1 system adenine-specific DNA-methyltransferase PglX [Vibrio parahaemolyticus]
MNTNKLKAYAPKARVAFMEAVKNRAAKLGIFEDRISEITIDGDSAIIEKEVYTRKQGQQRNQLVKRIEALGTHDGKFVHKEGFNQFINETAFTWFNRLTAIRYMEVNEYLDHGFRVLSKTEGAQFGEGFEILNSAADVADELGLNKDQIIDMVLDGNKEEELYRTLLLAQCHQLSEAMPFMFEKLDDATELLLPDNLTKTDSILKDLVNDIPEDNWREIEVIGWLYQFYISEHKDAVIGKVVKREDIPAATQLFTPNWIVKYLVQNSLGRQWLATYPDSELKDKMEYYITPAKQSDDVIEQLKAITPTSIDPEEIKVLDPACGSGHILVEVYEVLREIYLERGYRLREIPELILTKNIYGLDIDDRAAQMASFAVLMKAREDNKRIFTREIKLNIHSIQSTENLNIDQLWADLDLDESKETGTMGDLFSDPKQEIANYSKENRHYLDLIHYFNEKFLDAKDLGALIEIDNKYLESSKKLKFQLEDKLLSSNPAKVQAAELLLKIVEQAIIIGCVFDVTITNPPYIGGAYLNKKLKDYTSAFYPKSKTDLYAVFFERCLKLTKNNHYLSLMTPFTWLSIKQFAAMRAELCANVDLLNLVQPEYHAFFESAYVPICAFTIRKSVTESEGSFVDLSDFYGADIQSLKYLEAVNDINISYRYHRSTREFKSLPNTTFMFEASESLLNSFINNDPLGSKSDISEGIKTGDNEKFLRFWHEVDIRDICLSSSNLDKKWRVHHKGGEYRRWYGNLDYVVNWEFDGKELKNSKKSGLQGKKNYESEGVTWSKISSSYFGVRYLPDYVFFDSGSPAAFPHNKDDSLMYLAFLSSNTASYIVKKLNPTLNFQVGNVASLPAFPVLESVRYKAESIAEKCLEISKSSWDSQEYSFDFRSSPLMNYVDSKISNSFDEWLFNEENILTCLSKLEMENNQLFIDAFSLSDIIDPNQDLKQITLFSNTKHRYDERTEENHSSKLQCDTVREFISYAFSCMMGRYSLDREGLVYAHSSNNGFKELVAEGAYKTFPADDDGIVPLADEDWVFEDDATTRFREFVKTVWGDEHLQENLDFVAESLCLDAIKAKKGESSIDTIRRYFSTQFYKDHLKTYKKRPIYWLFSSGKAKAFECLVYLHRYNEGTMSRMRTEYVTPLMGKLESRKNILEDSKATASGAELRTIDKELKTIEKKQAELVTFDEELKHLAEMKISLDLDDGVKVNYGKFGNLLADVKAIHGKNPEVIK